MLKLGLKRKVKVKELNIKALLKTSDNIPPKAQQQQPFTRKIFSESGDTSSNKMSKY